jgi:peptidoglycan hydrolase CwlO-like protein
MVDMLKKELNSAQKEISVLKSDLSTRELEINKTINERNTKTRELNDTQMELAKEKARMSFTTSGFNPKSDNREN